MSISFDRVADDYDRTRGYPPGVAEQIGPALLAAAGLTREPSSARILELGVGTGRIALPIIRAGYPYTGIDLSSRMLDRLRTALLTIPGAAGRVSLREGDITVLPFADRSFDVVLSVHVYHLVVDRARAIAESVRVLARPGVALNGHDDPRGKTLRGEVEGAWLTIVRELGWEPPPPQPWASGPSVVEEWRWLGGQVDQIVAVEWETARRPREAVELLARRLTSGTWALPEELAAPAAERLRAWGAAHYGSALDTPVTARYRFVIDRARFS